ncbi:MAG: transcription antitermination factor NusB [Myxococcales bacterium]|nr:transcription antitermination factor NusB [Myxococcales bacterium]
MGSRRRARETALQILFGLDWSHAEVPAALEEFWDRFAGERPANYDEVRDLCRDLVTGVVQARPAIDQKLQAASHHWKLERMTAVDRNILRLGAYELLYQADTVPRKVAINEAIEVAKKFGNEDSGSFINGILDRVAHDLVRSTERAKGRAAGPAPVRAPTPPPGGDDA